MAADDLTAALEKIREHWAARRRLSLGFDPVDGASLLAAIEAVLELTEPSGEIHYDLDGFPEEGVVRVVRCDKVREAISRELTKGER